MKMPITDVETVISKTDKVWLLWTSRKYTTQGRIDKRYGKLYPANMDIINLIKTDEIITRFY